MPRKRCLAVLLFLVLCPMAAADPAFEMVGWQFHDYDMPLSREAIALAPDYGVNFIILSHGLIGEASQVLKDDARAADLAELTEWAALHGIRTYLWLHELNDLPIEFMQDGLALVDHPALPTFLRGRYDDLFRRMPGIAGIVMTLHESGRRIFRSTEVISELPVPDRMMRILDPCYDACKAAGKQLIVRNFFYQPKEVEWFSEALGRLPDDVLVMGKTTPHEFMPFFPPDPMMGRVPGKKSIVEFDLGYEKATTSHSAYCQIEYIGRYARTAESRGATGVVGRCHLGETQGFNKLGECNYYAFSRFAANPGLGADSVLREWVKLRFPPAAVEPMISALSRTQEMAHRSRYTLSCWVYPLRGYHYAFGHIRLRSTYLWSRDEADREMTELLMHPTPELYERILGEKDEVMEMCKASLADFERAALHMHPEQAAPIRDRFERNLFEAKKKRAASRSFWAFRLWLEGRQEYRDDVLAGFEQLRELDPDDGRVVKFIAELEEKMADPEAARAEDEKIMREISYRLDPERRAREGYPD